MGKPEIENRWIITLFWGREGKTYSTFASIGDEANIWDEARWLMRYYLQSRVIKEVIVQKRVREGKEE